MTTEQRWTGRFRALIEVRPGGAVRMEIPFEPAQAWGERDAYYVDGTIDGHGFRGRLTKSDEQWFIQLGPAWARGARLPRGGDDVEVVIAPEGPQSTTLGADVAAAFARERGAARFFDSLATFYRKNHARWLEAAKRPETRAKRIEEIVDLSKRGIRER